MQEYFHIFLNNITPFFANIGILILTAWVISFYYNKTKSSLLNMTSSDKIIIGLLLGLSTILLINSPVKLDSGIIMDTRGVPLLISGMIGGPISGLITMAMGLFTRYYYGGAGMIGGLIYIIIFSLSGIIWYKLNNINKFPSERKLSLLVLGITVLTIPVLFTLPEDKRVWALITIWPLMFLSNGFGAYIIASVLKKRITQIDDFFLQEQTIKEQKEQLTQKDLQLLEHTKMIALGEMLSSIAHQWRQPLSVISTSIGGLQLKVEFGESPKKEDIEHAYELITNQTNYLSNTIDSFTNFVKAEKVKKDIDIKYEMLQAKQIIEVTLKNHHIELIDKIDYTNPLEIFATQGELAQVFINIINNAKDIILEKEVEGGFIILEMLDKTSSVVFTIEDNGGGIPKKIMDRIFEPYFTTKHQSMGTGLGLHICYNIVSNGYFGNIGVENTENGAKFSIEIPIIDSLERETKN